MDHEHQPSPGDLHGSLSRDVITAIDACRPDSDDDRLPEVASVLDRESSARVGDLRRSVERIDRAVTAATRQVSVPDGLADRILAGIHAIDLASAGPKDASAWNVAKKHRSRRRVVWIGTGLAMAASLLIGLGLWSSRPSIELAEAQAQVRTFYETDDHAAPLSDSLQTSLPIPTSLVIGGRSVALFGRAGRAYELTPLRRVRATLYVIPLWSYLGPNLTGLPTTPQPQGTLGVTTAAWKSGTDVYVLAVQGNEQDFWRFFPPKKFA